MTNFARRSFWIEASLFGASAASGLANATRATQSTRRGRVMEGTFAAENDALLRPAQDVAGTTQCFAPTLALVLLAFRRGGGRSAAPLSMTYRQVPSGWRFQMVRNQPVLKLSLPSGPGRRNS